MYNFKDYYESSLSLIFFSIDVNQRKVIITATVPSVVIDSNYDMNGKLLVLPINGQGKANITIGKYMTQISDNFREIDKIVHTLAKTAFKMLRCIENREEL